MIAPNRYGFFALLGFLLTLSAGVKAESRAYEMESLTGEGVWVSPISERAKRSGAKLRATVWFEKQWLGDGRGYERRSREFAQVGRRELRKQVVQALKAESEQSHQAAAEDLKRLQKRKVISDLERHWIVNGFSCSISEKDLGKLEKVPGVRKIFFAPQRNVRRSKLPKGEKIAELEVPTKPSYEELPWYVQKLKADRVWKEFGFAGQGTLNVFHDRNFVFSEHLLRTGYRNPKEIADNGIDDDGNGYVDDYYGCHFERKSGEIYTIKFSGEAKDRAVLHGTSCAIITSGAATPKGVPQFGIAPLSRWAGVVNPGGIERSVEWAIEQGADTYSMSFTRRGYGEYESHWRKVMEHGAFCGVYFVSGAGNRKKDAPEPLRMHIPQSIPNAVFAAAGVRRDLSQTKSSCVGPVEWETEHYQDGVVQKPEVCAFNQKLPCLFPDGQVMPELLNGNSYAGPMFCGAISLMLSADPDLLPWDLKEIVTSTATDVGPKGVDYQTGHGLINCHAAVKEVLRRKALR